MRWFETLLVVLVLTGLLSLWGWLMDYLIGFKAHPWIAFPLTSFLVVVTYPGLKHLIRSSILKLLAPRYYERLERLREMVGILPQEKTFPDILNHLKTDLMSILETDVVAIFVKIKRRYRIEAAGAPEPMLLEGLTCGTEHEIVKKLLDSNRPAMPVQYSINDLSPEEKKPAKGISYRDFKVFNWALPLKVKGRLTAFILTHSMPIDIQFRLNDELFQRILDELAILIDNRKLMHRIKTQTLRQQIVQRVAEKMTTTRSPTALFNFILDELHQILPIDACGVFLVKKDSYEIDKFIQHGYDRRRINPLKLKVGRGIVGQCIARKEPILIRDVRQVPHYIPGRSQTRSELCVPLVLGKRIFGALNLESNRIGAYSHEDQDFLLTLATQAAAFLEQNEERRQVEQEAHFSEEMDQAEELQRSLLPQTVPVHDEISFALEFIPSQQIGGDFYDLMPLPGGNKFLLAVGDVVGKGISGALLMSNFYSIYKRTVQEEYGDLVHLCRVLNAQLAEEFSGGKQISFFVSRLDARRGVLNYVNAGHPPAMVFHRDGSYERLETGGPILGADPNASYAHGRQILQPNDLLVLYTDGFIEAMDRSGQLFDESGLIEEARQLLGEPVEIISRALLEHLRNFTKKENFDDDLTLILARYHPRT